MSKAELVEAIASELEGSKAETERFVAAAMKIITEKLVQGEKITLPDVGTLEVGFRAARKGRNPQTGEVIDIEASRVAKFKASKKLKDALKD